MSKVCIKVCAMAQLQQIVALNDLAAQDFKGYLTMMGLIFYPPSPRFILKHLPLHYDQAAQSIVEHSQHLKRVGVFVDSDDATILHYANMFKLFAVQLHGKETAAQIIRLKEQGLFVIKTLAVAGLKEHFASGVDKAVQSSNQKEQQEQQEQQAIRQQFKQQASEALEKQVATFSKVADAILFDYASCQYGGVGLGFDWQVLDFLKPITESRFKCKFILAGGIGASNFTAALDFAKKHHFWALDLNSKFENAPADKNIQLIKDTLKQAYE